MKKVSIIIPVYNEAVALRNNLPLLQPLRAQGHELIVVDGGQTPSAQQEFGQWVDHWLQSDAGRAKQMNAGAALASGEILLFLHIDTHLPDEGVTPVIKAFERLGNVWGRYDVRLSGARTSFRVIETMINLRSRVSGVATGDQALFIRRSLFQQVGGFPDIPLMEDVAISKTLRTKARPVCLRARVTTSSRRWEKHGVLKTVLLMWKIRALYFFGVAPNKLHGMYVTKKTPYRYPKACLALFAKAPVFGKVKTRMEGVLGKDGALSLHKALIHYVFSSLSDAALCPVRLWVATDGAENKLNALHDEFFLSISNINDIYEQEGADLGQRMAFAAKHALVNSDYVVLVGADCASVDAAYLESALAALESGDSIVIGPAEDGGYVLLGLRVVAECLFANMQWGEPSVLEATRQNLRNAGLAWVELAPRWDVDRPEDLARLPTLQPAFPKLDLD